MSTNQPRRILGEVLDQLQKSHTYAAQNKISEARAECLKAASSTNTLLSESGNSTVKLIASFTLLWYEKLKKDGNNALSVSDKLLWLSSLIYKVNWLPVIEFGKTHSTDIQPWDSHELEMQMPESLNLGVSFEKVRPSPGLDGFDDLCQDLLPNCSFVLSLLSIHDMGLGNRLESLVKYNNEAGCAKVKLYINGCWREIKISTELPFIDQPHSDRYMIVRSSTNKELLWPALLEKAYLFALGEHYNFSGSNMAQDTHMLLGWPPEVRKISNMSLALFGEFWELKKKGTVALGLGTGHMSESLASKLKIVPGHDYVVCDYDGEAITLKNPWVSDSRERLLRVDASVFGHFTYVYLNWNVDTIYRYNNSLAVICPPPLSDLVLLDRPQLLIENRSSEAQEVAISIEQFLLGSQQVSPFSVQVYENTNGKVISASQYPQAAGSKMTKSRVGYLNFTIGPKSCCTVVITGPRKRELFLARLWSHFEVTFSRAKNPLPNLIKMEDSWTKGEGGNWGQEMYVDNPQWQLIAKRRLKVVIVLTSNGRTDLTTHLFYTDRDTLSSKLRNFDKSKLLSGEDYSPRIKLTECELPEAGSYRLVASSYDGDSDDSFQMLVMYDGEKGDLEAEKIPKALGLYSQESRFEWNSRNRYKIFLSSGAPNNALVVRLQHGSKPQNLSMYRPAIRASLFDGVTQEPVAINDKWNDCVYGVYVDCVLRKPQHKYILLVERFETGDGKCRLTFSSSGKLDIRGEDD